MFYLMSYYRNDNNLVLISDYTKASSTIDICYQVRCPIRMSAINHVQLHSLQRIPESPYHFQAIEWNTDHRILHIVLVMLLCSMTSLVICMVHQLRSTVKISLFDYNHFRSKFYRCRRLPDIFLSLHRSIRRRNREWPSCLRSLKIAKNEVRRRK